MKRNLLLSVGVLIALTTFARSFEYEYEGQTLNYTVLSETEKTVEITSAVNLKAEPLVIPSTVKDTDNETYTVITIGVRAFKDGCMTSVSIPETITSINGYAFLFCNNLTKAEFSSIEALCNITFGEGKLAWDAYWEQYTSNPIFYAKNLWIDGKEITTLEIPESVTSIGNFTFAGCNTLTSIKLHESITSIGDFAFAYCENLTSINLPQNLDRISNCMFDYCKNLSSITIPDSVTLIGNYAFNGCKSLTTITIPNTVERIERCAFSNCIGLNSIFIPESVTFINDYAFSDCDFDYVEFSSIEHMCNIAYGSLDPNPLKFSRGLRIDGQDIVDLVIPETVTTISSYTFSGAKFLTSVNIPESVHYIGYEAFTECSGLSLIVIPNSVTKIATGAFTNCTNLKSATISNAVTELGYSIFGDCSNLTSIYYDATDPVKAEREVFTGSYGNEDIYNNATLYVHSEAIDKCKTISPWKYFNNIKPYNDSIEYFENDCAEEQTLEYINLNGVKVGTNKTELTPGLYIEKNGNSVKKISIN